jgi:hypothetical protein
MSSAKFPRSDSVTSENIDVIENEDGKKEFRASTSRAIAFINWAYVAKLYLPVLLGLVVLVLLFQVGTKFAAHGFDIKVLS